MSREVVGELVEVIAKLPSDEQKLLLKIATKLTDPMWVQEARKVFGEELSETIVAIAHVDLAATCDFPLWKTIMLPMFNTPHDYINARRKQTVSVGDSAALILPKMVCLKKREAVSVHRATLAELGLPNGGSYSEAVSAIARLGGRLCSIELVLAIRLQYTVEEQPRNERLIAAMQPIEVEKDRSCVLVVQRRNWVRWLVSEDITPTTHFDADTEFLFTSEATSVSASLLQGVN